MSNFDNQLVPVPIDEIKVRVNMKNIRTVFDPEKIKELADSIHKEGLMTPLTVMLSENENGEAITELVAGERRLRAIQLIRNSAETDFMDDGVPCIHFAGLVHDAEFINAIENIAREQVDDVDSSEWLANRVKNGVSQAELARRIHKRPQWVNFRVLFNDRACPVLKDALRAGLISFMAAYELSKNCSPEEQEKWIAKHQRLNEKITLQQAQNAGNQDKTKKPGAKARKTILARAELCADTKGSELARGMAFGLRWVDGLLTDEEIEEILEAQE